MGGALAACSSDGGTQAVFDSGTPATDQGAVDAGTPTTDHGGNIDAGTPGDTGAPGDTGGNTPTDGGSKTDAAPADAPSTGDAGAADAGNDPYDPCSTALLVDLNAMGTTAGAVTTITRNNNSVGARSPLSTTCTTRTGHEVAFRYTPRTNARLRISTDNAGTDMTLDTIIWAQPACAAAAGDAGTMELGCNDDGGNSPRDNTSILTTSAPVTMGTPIYIVVAGYTPPTSSSFIAQGTFVLSVTEIPTVAVGAACDTTGATNSCATGSVCYAASGTTGTCIANGALHGGCRSTGDACDAGLGCDGSVTSSFSRCITAVAAGGACDPDEEDNICATGTVCITSGSTSTCVTAGTAGGPCRAAAPYCDGTLTCSDTDEDYDDGVCFGTVASGAACVPGSLSARCAATTACLPTSPTAGTCSTGHAETEPNNSPDHAQAAITASTIISGTASDTDMDCFAVTVPAGGAIFAEANLPMTPTCPRGATSPDPVIDLFAPGATVDSDTIAHADDTLGRNLCGTLNPATATGARGLAAGTYTVCISGYADAPAANYLLTIGVYSGL